MRNRILLAATICLISVAALAVEQGDVAPRWTATTFDGT
jgi:hypothetical protein